MKKILIFLIILGAITFINIDLFAFTFNNDNSPATITLDTGLEELNYFSLREVFEDYKISVSSTGGYVGVFGDGYIFSTPVGNTSQIFGSISFSTLFPVLATDKIYVKVVHDQTTPLNLYFETSSPYHSLGYPSYNSIDNNSFIYQRINDQSINSYINLTFWSTASGLNYQLGTPIVVNLTDLGIDYLTLDELDFYYTIYSILKLGGNPTLLYSEFYTHGQLQGYNDGYDAGNLQGYNDGYDDGLFDYHTGNYYGQYDYTLSEPYNQATQANISLLSVFSLIIGVVMSMLGFIINIEMFGISIASILGTLAIGVSIIWLLKLIRG